MEEKSKKYEDKLIVFLDILGFSNMVKESENDEKKFEIILDFVSDLQETIKKSYEFELRHEEIMQLVRDRDRKEYVNPSKFDYAMFSDSIVITMEFLEAHSLVKIISNFGLIQAKYMSKGLLVRGGITYGKVYHKGSICFGPGFIKAYKLEQFANYPRIIIDKGILDGTNIPIWDKNKESMYKYLILPWLDQEINPLALLDKETGYYYINPFVTHNSHDYFEEIVVSIQTQLEEFQQNPKVDERVIEKWEWLWKDINRNPKVISGQIRDKFMKH